MHRGVLEPFADLEPKKSHPGAHRVWNTYGPGNGPVHAGVCVLGLSNLTGYELEGL